MNKPQNNVDQTGCLYWLVCIEKIAEEENNLNSLISRPINEKEVLQWQALFDAGYSPRQAYNYVILGMRD